MSWTAGRISTGWTIKRGELADERPYPPLEGCNNVRDLGGLRTSNGCMTRRGGNRPFGYPCEAHCGGLVARSMPTASARSSPCARTACRKTSSNITPPYSGPRNGPGGDRRRHGHGIQEQVGFLRTVVHAALLS
ncbi:MAG: tyrosine-protein phosphatase [Ignavibacteriales bacterium]|nr:tyrosine-protein phosphatase [Ignavibacteriales bacterium]